MMGALLSIDETLAGRLPLPLAQLYRRAHNAKTPLERHQAAYYLWEASLKLLGCVAVVEYAEMGDQDDQLVERLQNLARPALGHWWEFVRRLVPVLADAGDDHFDEVRGLLLGRTRDDMPGAAGLYGALLALDDQRSGARSTVRLAELYDRLVQYRAETIGHGAAGLRSPQFYDRLGCAMLRGVAEILGRIDPLAGRRLIYVGEVRRRNDGGWRIDQYELIGESARRLEPRDFPASDTENLPSPECVYSASISVANSAASAPRLRPLRPLLVYDDESRKIFFLNARRGQRKIEYLCYNSGDNKRRQVEIPEQRELLARVLGQPVDDARMAAWVARTTAEEGAAEEVPQPTMRMVGDFELLSRIGSGGMGVVYRAWQPSLGRQVALKCLLRTGDRKLQVRFAREIRALGRVDHPNVVKIYTSGDDGEHWFYAMELIEGADLATICEQLLGRDASEITGEGWHRALTTACDLVRRQEESLSPEQAAMASDASSTTQDPAGDTAKQAVSASETVPDGARRRGTVGNSPSGTTRLVVPSADDSHIAHVVEIVRQVAEAAHTLHEAKVIHRDIKPANIMLPRDGSHAVLMDLGLAQLADEMEGQLTQTFVGTLRYASPEQILRAANVDRRSDVYSLGATLWELLTLRPLYGATEQTPTFELMLKIQQVDPDRPRKYNPRIPRDLEAIVTKCLSRDRSQRYATASELAADLARWQRGEAVLAQPLSVRYVVGKYVRRHRLRIATVATAAMLLLVFSIAGFSWLLHDWRSRGEILAEARENLYVADVSLAYSYWNDGNGVMAKRLLERQPRELWGFEWRLLWHEIQADPALYGHEGQIRHLAFSHDGRWLASASYDATARLWRPDSGEVRILEGHEGAVFCVAFSGDDRFLATASTDRTVRLWDVATGRQITILKDHKSVVTSVAYSPDGRYLASGGDDTTVRVYDMQGFPQSRPRLLHVLDEHPNNVHSIAFAPSGRLVAAGGKDQTVRVWNIESGAEVRVMSGGHSEEIYPIAFSPDGKWLASGGADGAIAVWQMDESPADFAPGPRKILRGHRSAVYSLDFANGTQLASGDLAGNVVLWDVTRLEEDAQLQTIQAHSGSVFGIAFRRGHPETPAGDLGPLMATGSSDLAIRLWEPEEDLAGQTSYVSQSRRVPGELDVRTRAGEVVAFDAHRDSIREACFAPDDSWLATAGYDGAVRRWDPRDGTELEELRVDVGDVPGAKQVGCIAVSPDGRLLAAGTGDWTNTESPGHFVVWRIPGRDEQPPEKSRMLVSKRGHDQSINDVSFSSDGKLLVTASNDGTATVWSTADWTEQDRVDDHDHWVWQATLARIDGRRSLFTVGHDSLGLLTDLDRGEVRRTFRGHTVGVACLAYHPGRHLLATSGFDNTVIVRDLNSKRTITLLGHTGAVWSLAFSRDGRTLASGSWDGTVKLWHVNWGEEEQKGYEIASLEPAERIGGGDDDGISRSVRSEVYTVAFSQRGNMLVAAGKDGWVHLWHAARPPL